MIPASQIPPLIYYSTQMQDSAYPPSEGSAMYSVFEYAEHWNTIINLLLGNRVQSRNIE